MPPRQRGPEGRHATSSRPRVTGRQGGSKARASRAPGPCPEGSGARTTAPRRDRVAELERGGVQRLSTEFRHQLLGESTVGRREAQGLFGAAAVGRVADDRVSAMAQMNPDLVRPPGLERARRASAKRGLRRIGGQAWPARASASPPRAPRAARGPRRPCACGPCGSRPIAASMRPRARRAARPTRARGSGARSRARARSSVSALERGVGLGDDQEPARVLVEPVDEPRAAPRRPRPRSTGAVREQRVDERAAAHAGARDGRRARRACRRTSRSSSSNTIASGTSSGTRPLGDRRSGTSALDDARRRAPARRTCAARPSTVTWPCLDERLDAAAREVGPGAREHAVKPLRPAPPAHGSGAWRRRAHAGPPPVVTAA